VDLRSEAGLGSAETVALYIGNLENYQGIDLLLEGFARIAAECPLAHVVIIGGRSVHIAEYQSKARSAGLSQRVHFLGPRPVESLNWYLTQADILISPRTKGNNTPMKIYSYLHSGVPVVATALPTHTQVLTPEVALLAAPQADSFGLAMRALFLDPALRARIGSAARALAQRKYTFEHFRNTLNQIYDRVAKQIAGA